MTTEKEIRELIAKLKSRDHHVREDAIEALVKIGKSAILGLIEALKDENSDVKKEAVPVLLKILFEGKWDYRAAHALTLIATERGMPDLVAMVKKKKIHPNLVSLIQKIINVLREKEIREEIRKKWEALKREKPRPYIMAVHEYSESVGSLKIGSIKETPMGVEIPFTCEAFGMTEFGTNLYYDVTGVLEIDKSGKPKLLKWESHLKEIEHYDPLKEMK